MAKIYSDLALSFVANPNTGDVTPVTNERSVKLALRNLLATDIGTRPYDPEYGVNLKRYLFKQADALTEVDIIEEIHDAIKIFEPRAIVQAIEANVVDYGIEVTVEFKVKDTGVFQTLETLISRV